MNRSMDEFHIHSIPIFNKKLSCRETARRSSLVRNVITQKAINSCPFVTLQMYTLPSHASYYILMVAHYSASDSEDHYILRTYF